MSARELACIIGWPVNRSLSPAIHTAAFRAAGLDWTYVPIAVRPGAAAEGIGLLRVLGVIGANVTMPHKEAVVPLMDAVAGDAEVVRAVNTIVREGRSFVGHNTDGVGFIRFLAVDVEFDPAGADVVILGAGGAARAVAVALANAGARVTVCARRREQAVALTALAPGIQTGVWGKPPGADVVVNATPLREDFPVDLGRARLIVDMIYPPPETPLVARARAAGVPAFDGLGMLVHQAALSFELWTSMEAPLQAMRAAAEQARKAASPGMAE